MARTLTPERQKLKQEAISLRYDYGWTERRIAGQLQVSKSTIDSWLPKNTRMSLPNNNGHITHLEGDCLELLKTLPDNSVDVLLTDPPYCVMDDYEWDKKDANFYHQWLSLVKPNETSRCPGKN